MNSCIVGALLNDDPPHRQVNRSLDPCEDFSKYACSAWSPPRARADYATSSFTQLIRAWFEGFSGLLLDASKHGFTVADGPAAMLRACLNPNTKASVPGIKELRDLMASVHLNWPDPPDDEASPLGVLLRLAHDFGVRTWFTIRVYRRNTSHTSTVHLSPADAIGFAVKHHRRVRASKAYELLWQAFYSRFQEFGNGSTAPNDAAIERSAVMQTFVLEHIFEAKTNPKARPACFVMSVLDGYTANISSEEWIAEINEVIPSAHVSPSDNISVSDLAVLEAIDAIFKSFTRRDIMDYLGWQLAQLYGPLVDPMLSKEYFGDAERTAIYLPYVCAREVEASYPGLLAALHYLTRLDQSARNAVRMTLESVLNTTAALVDGVSWLDEVTKAAATAQLRSVKIRLWPPPWILEKEALTRTYSHFPVNATSLMDFLKLSRRAIRKLTKSEPEFEEVLSSPLSGSLPYFSYDQALGEVSISAGAVQFPLYVPGGTAVMNYAGLGFSFAMHLVRFLESVSRTGTAERRCTDISDGNFSSYTAALRKRSSCLAPAYNGSFFPEVVALEATHAAFLNSVGGALDGERLIKEFSNEQIFYIALCYFQCGRHGGRRDFFNQCNRAVMTLEATNPEVDGPCFGDGAAALAAVAWVAEGTAAATLFVGRTDTGICYGIALLRAASAYPASLYASLPSLVSESLRWASLVSLAFGWTEVVHRPLPKTSRRTMTLMDGVFTLFNVGSSVTSIRQGVYMVRQKENLFDICPGSARTAASSFASSAVLVTLSCVSAWRNKHGQPCSAYIWCVLGLLATAAVIDAVALAQYLWSLERMVLSDFNYQRGVVLVEVLAVFFLLGSFLSTGLRDRIVFKGHGHKSKERVHDDTSSPFGVFTCWPLRTHLANVVLRSKAVMEDLPLLPRRFKCSQLLQQFSAHLSEGCKHQFERPRLPPKEAASNLLLYSLPHRRQKATTTGRFVATIVRVLWIDVLWTVVSTLSYFGCVIIKVPILESLIEAPSDWHRATSAVLFAAASVADLVLCSYQTHVSLRMCMRVRSMLQAAIFAKLPWSQMTRLSPSALTRNPSGYVVSVLGVDCAQLGASMLQFPLPVIGSLCMPLVLGLLAIRAGTVPALGCAVWLMIVLFLPFPTSVLQNALWKRVMRFRDERLKSTTDLLSSVRVVKLYAWEDAYLGAVGRTRDAELAVLLRTNMLDGVMDSIYSSTSSMACVSYLRGAYCRVVLWRFARAKLRLKQNAGCIQGVPANLSQSLKKCLTIILFGLLAAVGGTDTLTPTLSFSCLYLLSLTDMITNMLANSLRMRSLVSLGLRRICKFCTEEEQEESLPDSKDPAIQKGEVVLSGCSFSWTHHSCHSSSPMPSEPSLRDVTFRAAPGSLVAVVGFVGSGKSSLLAAILGDMHRTRGTLRTSGSIAYVSQVAAIYNMTVRDNITFGKRFDPALYARVIKACELLNDLNTFPAGDLTEVGEKGETLSGGQKQRISLARAVYSCSHIYLLDDPLSALDPTVAARVFKHVVGKSGLLRNTTRILVCNQGSLLKHMDRLVLMHDGTASVFATVSELLQHKDTPRTVRAAHSRQANARQTTACDVRYSKTLRELPFLRPTQDLDKVERVPRRLALDDRDTSDQDEAKGRVTVEESITSSKTTLEVVSALCRLCGVCGPLALLCFVASAGAVAWQQLYVKRWTDTMAAGAGSSANWVGGLVAISLSDGNFHGLVGCGWHVRPVIFHSVQLLALLARMLTYTCARIPGKRELLFRTAGGFLLAASSQRLSRLMHRSMLEHLLASPMSFFDSTPRGRILARFSTDLDAIDSRLYLGGKQSLQNAFITVAKLVVVGTQTPPVLAVGVVAIVAMVLVMRHSIQASNAARYLESRNLSRMLQHVTETRDSLSTVRCLGAVPRFKLHYQRLSDLGMRAFGGFCMCFRFSRFAAGLCGLVVVLAALAFSVALAGREPPEQASSSVALALSSSLSIPMMTVALCLSLYVVLQGTVCFERDLEYTELPAESECQPVTEKFTLLVAPTLGDTWPSEGLVEFEKYSASYRTEVLPDVLKGVTFVVEPKEKVGVVGRTGAGKSSLVLALLRVLKASQGRILIDGVDVSTVPLRRLRSAVTVIPQDPTLVRGSLRDNLDPTRSHTDEQLWRALRQAHLSDLVAGRQEGLLIETGDGGSNLSVGQRQLVCLARALLRGPKILVLDEATSQMDGDTDRLIQATLRDAFAQCTVIAIAHRIHTVLDYDKILVMADGTVLEYGPVKKLLYDVSSAFHTMAKNAGALPFDAHGRDYASITEL
ncbi:ATP-binding cassette sub-family C member 3-like [Dermacentor andersoni]|uniref:ATP-binding cassette sub-family C member 3-like n=1 Tax=Dermacentor andersoni TaxID=34620 RepID=UPI003B3BC677